MRRRKTHRWNSSSPRPFIQTGRAHKPSRTRLLFPPPRKRALIIATKWVEGAQNHRHHQNKNKIGIPQPSASTSTDHNPIQETSFSQRTFNGKRGWGGARGRVRMTSQRGGWGVNGGEEAKKAIEVGVYWRGSIERAKLAGRFDYAAPCPGKWVP